MNIEGEPLHKMLAGHDPDRGGQVSYALHLGASTVPLAEHLGQPFSIRFTGARTCMSCGKRVKKFYGQGLCFPCLQTAPEASECIIRPELCRAHLGEGRDPAWEKEHHFTEHFVYLSYTGNVKVGVTRGTQVPVRWIDQGAVAALLIARTPYRQLAGAIEVALKASFADRTNWRAMLRPLPHDPAPLLQAREAAHNALPPELQPYFLHDAAPTAMAYPVLDMPPKVTSVSFDKLPEVAGTLAGIKGQYLIWKDGRVLNVRSHTGYHVMVNG